MTEQKNIVIKVKFPTPGNAPGKIGSGPGEITEWNFKRIGLVLGGLLLALTALFYFTSVDDQQTKASDTQLALPEPAAEVKPLPESTVKAPEQPKLEIDKAIVRAQLTTDINKNEPADNLKVPIKIGKKETLWIYYFVELKGMVGKAVYHEWWLNGNLVSRKKVNISADPWRTSSKQIITYTNNNDWIVRVVDESRNNLVEKSFNLELK